MIIKGSFLDSNRVAVNVTTDIQLIIVKDEDNLNVSLSTFLSNGNLEMVTSLGTLNDLLAVLTDVKSLGI